VITWNDNGSEPLKMTRTIAEVRVLARRGREELWLLVAVMLAAGGFLGFVSLAEEVFEGDTEAFDRTVLLAFRNPANTADPIGPAWVEEMMRDITSLGSHPILILVSLAAFGFLMMTRRPAAAWLLLVAVGGGMLLSTVLKVVFERARPDLVTHAAQVFTASFPSGHAMLSAITYLTLGALLARAQESHRVKAYLLGVAVILTVITGLSRVYLGVHWPTDVIAGWCVGAAWALLCWLVALWLERRGRIEKPSPGA
jgi:undecaprenyl-diphosphatase